MGGKIIEVNQRGVPLQGGSDDIASNTKIITSSEHSMITGSGARNGHGAGRNGAGEFMELDAIGRQQQHC
jgi:hypothetical protein